VRAGGDDRLAAARRPAPRDDVAAVIRRLEFVVLREQLERLQPLGYRVIRIEFDPDVAPPRLGTVRAVAMTEQVEGCAVGRVHLAVDAAEHC
jgi:hypothetical protein